MIERVDRLCLRFLAAGAGALFFFAYGAVNDLFIRARLGASRGDFVLFDGFARGMPERRDRFRLFLPAGAGAFAQTLLGAGGLIDDYPRTVSMGVFHGGGGVSSSLQAANAARPRAAAAIVSNTIPGFFIIVLHIFIHS